MPCKHHGELVRWLLRELVFGNRRSLVCCTIIVACASLFVTCTSPLTAATGSWVTPSFGIWTDAENWSGTVPNSPLDVARFAETNTPLQVFIDAPITVQRIEHAFAADIAISGDESLTFGELVDQASHISQTEGAGRLWLNAPLHVTSDHLIIETNNQSLVEMASSLDAPFDITTRGSGTVLLSGDNSQWAGALTIESGEVTLADAASLGTGSATIQAEGTLRVSSGIQFADESIHLNGGQLKIDTTENVSLTGSLRSTGTSVVNMPSGGRFELLGMLTGSGDLMIPEGQVDFRGTDTFGGTIVLGEANVTSANLSIHTPLQSDVRVVNGTVDVLQANGSSGQISLEGGDLQLRSVEGGSVRLAQGKLTVGRGDDATISGIWLAGEETEVEIPADTNLRVDGPIRGTGPLNLTNRGTVIIDGQSTANRGDLVITGDGTTIASEDLRHTGTTYIQSGTLSIREGGTSPIVVSPMAALAFRNSSPGYAGNVVSEGATIYTSSSGTHAGSLTLQGGTTEISAGRTLRLRGEVNGVGDLNLIHRANESTVELSGGIDLVGQLTADVPLNNSASFEFGPTTIEGGIRLDGGDFTFAGPLTLDGDASFLRDGRDGVRLLSDGNTINGHVDVGPGVDLRLDGDTTMEKLRLDGVNGVPARVLGDGDLIVTQPIELAGGWFGFGNEGSLVGDTRVIQSTNDRSFLVNLGDRFEGTVEVYEGTVRLNGPKALGGGGAASVLGPTAQFEIDSSEPVMGPLNLNGFSAFGEGALTGEGEFAGALFLGDSGAAVSGRLTLSGPVQGGDMAIRNRIARSSEVTLTSDDVTYDGNTRIRGTRYQSSSLILDGPTSLQHTAGVTVEFGGLLSIRDGDLDRVGDHIPIVLRGGKLELGGSGAEVVGPVTIEAGAARVVSSMESQLSFAALELERGATLRVGTQQPVRVLGLGPSDFLGSQVVTLSNQSRFVKYDPAVGIVPLASDDYMTATPPNWTESSHVLLNDDSTLQNDQLIRSLTMSRRLNLFLSGSDLNVISGGIVASSGGIWGPGRLTAGGTEGNVDITIFSQSDFVIAADITDHPGSDGQYDSTFGGPLDQDNGKVGLVVHGEVILLGSNTYSADTRINEGSLTILSSSAASPTSRVEINGGSLGISEGVTIMPPEVFVADGGIGGLGQMETPLITMESGAITSNVLLGSGRIVKQTDGAASISAQPNFSGIIEVEQGLLTFEGEPGTGRIIVREGGRIRGRTIDADLELAGGSIDESITLKAGNVLDVTADSRIGSGEIRSDLVIDDGVTLTRTGRGDFTFSADLLFGDDARLEVFEVHDSNRISQADIFVGRNAELRFDRLVELRGTLIASGLESSLTLSGPTIEHVEIEYRIPTDTSLSVIRNEDATLKLNAPNGRLTGGGTLAQNLDLGGRARVAPGDTLGVLEVDGTMRLVGESRWDWEFYDAVGMPGSDWDLIRVRDAIETSGLPAESIVLSLVGVDQQGDPGDVANFDPFQSQSWQLATATQINGLTGSMFRVDADEFVRDVVLPAGAVFRVDVDGQSISLRYDVLLGDINADQELSVVDLDLLTSLLRAGITDSTYDVNRDGEFNVLDHTNWIEDIANTYVGDTNLDGVFDEQDIIAVFIEGKYTNRETAGWAEGDWNGSGFFDEQDFVAAFTGGGYLLPPRESMRAVPEPSSITCLAIGMAITCLVRLRRSAPTYLLVLTAIFLSWDTGLGQPLIWQRAPEDAGSFHDPSNWSPQTIPNPFWSFLIDNGGVSVMNDGMTTVPGATIGFEGTGTLRQNGGELNVEGNSPHFTVGGGAGSHGTYELNGGTTTVVWATVGQGGEGHVLMSGGEFRFEQSLAVGRSGHGTGSFIQSGGIVGAPDQMFRNVVRVGSVDGEAGQSSGYFEVSGAGEVHTTELSVSDGTFLQRDSLVSVVEDVSVSGGLNASSTYRMDSDLARLNARRIRLESYDPDHSAIFQQDAGDTDVEYVQIGMGDFRLNGGRVVSSSVLLGGSRPISPMDSARVVQHGGELRTEELTLQPDTRGENRVAAEYHLHGGTVFANRLRIVSEFDARFQQSGGQLFVNHLEISASGPENIASLQMSGGRAMVQDSLTLEPHAILDFSGQRQLLQTGIGSQILFAAGSVIRNSDVAGLRVGSDSILGVTDGNADEIANLLGSIDHRNLVTYRPGGSIVVAGNQRARIGNDSRWREDFSIEGYVYDSPVVGPTSIRSNVRVLSGGELRLGDWRSDVMVDGYMDAGVFGGEAVVGGLDIQSSNGPTKFTVSDGGSLRSLSWINVRQQSELTMDGANLRAFGLSVDGNSHFQQHGGTTQLRAFSVGRRFGGFGTVEFTDGQLTADEIAVGTSRSGIDNRFVQTRGSVTAGLFYAENYIMHGGTLTIQSEFENTVGRGGDQSTGANIDLTGSNATINIDGAVLNFSGRVPFENGGQATIHIDEHSLVTMPAGTSLEDTFGTVRNEGLVHFNDTPLVIGANREIHGSGSLAFYADSLEVHGKLVAERHGLFLGNRVRIRPGADINLGYGGLASGTAGTERVSEMSGGRLDTHTITVESDGDFLQSGGQVIANTIRYRSHAKYTLEGGSLTIREHLDDGVIDFDGGNAELRVDTSGVLNLDRLDVHNSSGASLHGEGSSLIIANLDNPPSDVFRQFTTDGLLHLIGQPLDVPDDQTLWGEVVIDGGLVNAGTIEPGRRNRGADIYDPRPRTGRLSVAGDFAQTESGRLRIEITNHEEVDDSSSRPANDVLSVSGVAKLDGVLSVNDVFGYIPTVGDSYEILSASSIEGEFRDLQLPPIMAGLRWDVEYLSDAVHLAVRAKLPGGPTPLGDFDEDGLLDADDINDLTRALNEFVYQDRFDINGDYYLDDEDRRLWVEEVRFTTFGDANLDGRFDNEDFVDVFIAGEYEDDLPMNSDWGDGDWNGDLEFNAEDIVFAFIAGGYQREAAGAVPVPEPRNVVWVVLWMAIVCRSYLGTADRRPSEETRSGLKRFQDEILPKRG